MRAVHIVFKLAEESAVALGVAKFERGKRHDRFSAKHQPEAEWHDFNFIHPDVDITKLPDPQSSVPRGIKV